MVGVKAFSWQPGPIPLINNDTSIWIWIKKETFSLPCKKNVSHSGFVWAQFWEKVEGLVSVCEWDLVHMHVPVCIYVCLCVCERACAMLGKWACQYAVQASLWWQADDSAVIGLISPRTWGEIWRLPQGSGAYHLPAHTLTHRFGCLCTQTHTEIYSTINSRGPP